MRKSLKDYFIPHEGNNYAPHSLQRVALTGMALLVVLSFASTNMYGLLWQSSQWMVGTVLPAVIVQLTNEERTDADLSTLQRSPVLDAAATLKAQNMATKGYFSHYAPDGTSPWYWFSQVDYNFVHAGENLAIHFVDSGEIVTAWMNSPSHRENILDGTFQEIGVGTAQGVYEGFETVFVVQLFGTPSVVPEVAGTNDQTVAIAPEPVVVSEPEPVAITSALSEVAAEAVLISESILLEPAEQIVSINTISPELATTSLIAETKIAEVVASSTGFSLYSDFVSTSTGGIAANTNGGSTPHTETVSFMASIATQPNVLLQLAYTVIAGFVFFSLFLSVAIEIRRQQPLQIAYSIALILIMFGLFELQSVLMSGAVVL